MILEIEESVSNKLNDRADTLLAKLAPRSENPKDSISNFRPNYLNYSLNLTGIEFPGIKTETVIDITGSEVERFFPELSPRIGLSGEDHKEFIDICEAILQLDNFGSHVSMTLIVETVFDWLRQRHLKSTSQKISEHILSVCGPVITENLIWIPIFGLSLESEIDLGKVTLKTVTDKRRRNWISEWNVRRPEDVNRINDFLKEIGNSDVSVSEKKVLAEPIKAVEIALKQTEEALMLLRYFSAANFEPNTYIYTAIAGTEHVERPKHMFLQDNIITVGGWTEVDMRSHHSWILTDKMVPKFEERGLDKLIKLSLMDSDKKTEFHKVLLNAVQMYSRVSLAQNLNEKLLYVVVVLESLLLKNAKEPLQKNISERMALLIGKSIEERLHIIKRYKESYLLRSRAVHHGKIIDESSSETVRDFLTYSWWTLNKLIEKSDDFENKSELIQFIDDTKLK